MNAMEINEQTLELLRRSSSLIADAIVKKTHPRNDDISEHKAMELYGAKWLRYHKKLGSISYHYLMGKITYSIHELNCLRAAERDNYEAVMRIIHRDDEPRR